jgi:adenylate cyclase
VEAEKTVLAIRKIFEKNPGCAERMLSILDNPDRRAGDEGKRRLVRSLIAMYRGDNFGYLNYYGGPRTIATVPYFKVLEHKHGDTGIDVKGKTVFVGSSDSLQQEQKDGFRTAFTGPNGLELSGVEIAATAFGNFLEIGDLRRPGSFELAGILLAWGIGVGVLCRLLPPALALASSAGICALYLVAAGTWFAFSASWYPVIIPLFIQAPFALLAGIVWKYAEVKKERHNIREAFRHYLPVDVVERLAKDLSSIKSSGRLVHGTCLVTDAENYSTLSESMDPRELSDFMNGYYEKIFEPVKRRLGEVSNVVGDSMLAIWASAEPDSIQRDRACIAALDIAAAGGKADDSPGPPMLSSRIGIHSGPILLGNLGAIDHYEYRPVGDIVNTATRIEGLNKHLGTTILATDETVKNLESILTREIGKFLLVGKGNPVVVHELLCMREGANDRLSDLCATFARGVELFRSGSFAEAAEKFRAAAEDGPSMFYLNLCVKYCNNPPEGHWDGIIRMSVK